MQQYREGQRLKGSDGNIYVVQGGVPRLATGGPSVVMPAPQKPEAPKFIPGVPGVVLGDDGNAKPIGNLPQTKTTWRTLSMQEKQARGLDPAGDYQISSDGQITSIASPRNQQNQLTATERGKAIQGYTDAKALERIADNLEAQYKAGPGKTKGLAGLQDVLPTARNRKFDDTSFQARGLVKRALGFTGGEGNTIGEIQLNYGPYLPEAGDYDDRILGKIEALRQLAQDARTRSVAMLGGTPDVNGKITPVQEGQSDPNAPVNFRSNQGQPPRPPRQGERAVYDPDSDSWAYINNEAERTAPQSLEVDVQGGRMDPNAQQQINQRVNQTDTFGSGLMGAADALSFGLSDEAAAGINALGGAISGQGSFGDLYGQNLGIERGVQDTLRQRDPGASLAGNIAGSAIGLTGLNAAVRGIPGISGLATRGGGMGTDIAYGGAYGAGAANEDRGIGALTGGLAAGAGNLVGRGIVNAGGKLVGGATSPALRYLNDRGIPLTPGQIAGQGGIVCKGFKAIEDAVESIPFVGSAVRTRREEGLNAFNREAFKDALKPVNQQVEGTIGQDAIGEAQELVSGAYGDALSGVNLRPDGSFIRQTDDILRRGSAVPVMGEQFNYVMGQQIDPLFNPDMSGRNFQAALQTLNKAKTAFNKQGIMGNAVAEPTGEMRGAFIDLANRQAPGATPALNAANSANKNVSILEDAVTQAVNSQVESGLFTPAQLARMAVNNTKKFGGKKAAARGDVPFRELTEAGQAALPSRVPNSGTADRAWATMILPVGLGGTAAGSEALGLDPKITGTLAGLGLLSTKKGNQLFQAAALKRNPEFRALGEAILNQRRLLGMFGSAAAVPMSVPALGGY